MAFVVGELIGFVPPAAAGVTLASIEVADAYLVIGLTLAGVLEGTAIGITQARVLGRYAPSVDGRRWIVATAGAAGFAWFVGMGGSALLGANIAPTPALIVLLAPAWCAALASMGYAQWRVLRTTVAHSQRWIGVTAGRVADRRRHSCRCAVLGAQ